MWGFVHVVVCGASSMLRHVGAHACCSMWGFICVVACGGSSMLKNVGVHPCCSMWGFIRVAACGGSSMLQHVGVHPCCVCGGSSMLWHVGVHPCCGIWGFIRVVALSKLFLWLNSIPLCDEPRVVQPFVSCWAFGLLLSFDCAEKCHCGHLCSSSCDFT